MAFQAETLPGFLAHGFDTLIDVRSPAEYAEDRMPGAINLPVLSNAERAHVGTIYVQEDPFLARKVGAALVARNAALHLEGPLAGKDGSWRPLVYCWRGGQRSGSFASILAQIGWRVDTVAGGYRAWRQAVVAALHDDPWPTPLVLLDGNTGTAKTEILSVLAARGLQVLDLEGLAGHRGSVFGARGGAQPAQKMFETRIAAALAEFDPARPVVVEAESAKVGDRLVPPVLWAAMKAAPRVLVRAPVEARVTYLVQAYADIAEDKDRLSADIEGLKPYHGAERVADWLGFVETGAHLALASALISEHYDPRYARSRAARPAPVAEAVTERLDGPGIEGLADAIAALPIMSEGRDPDAR
ncbi:MAG: tRNA 2-selenouridine(34) synthase MnmH [Pseudomonadota bacterium]